MQAARRVLLCSAFFYTKQSGRIKQVLQQVREKEGGEGREGGREGGKKFEWVKKRGLYSFAL